MRHCIDYLVVGQPERDAYPQLQPLIDQSTALFAPAFRNEALSVYFVIRDRQAPICQGQGP